MHLSELAAAHPDKPAVVMADGSEVRTYAELDRRSRAVAAGLRADGVGVGDHVAVLMENRPEYLDVAWGALRAGTLWTPVNRHLTEDEAAYVVADCGARVLVASAATRALALRIAARVPDLVRVFVPGSPAGDERVADLATLLGGDPPAAEDEREGIYFFYSSGTTGTPKGIHPEHDFPPFGTGLRLERVMAESFGFGPGTVYLCPAPLYHAAPIGWSIGTQRHGGTVVLMERFDPRECLHAIETHRVTHAQFVPTHFVRMLKLPDEQREAVDVASLRVAVHAAAPCPVEVKRAMIGWWGPVLMEFYAGSEGAGMTAITSAQWLAHPGSVGRATLGVVHVVDDDGRELPPGETGTVYFSDGLDFAYHNDPEKTARAHDVRGWATLGDLGHLDDEGYLYLDDRRTDLIITGGVNVYPAEVEDALVVHPAVADVAVIGEPDPEMGHSVLAVIQPAEGVIGDAALAETLRAHARERLAGFKAPRRVTFTDELPRLPTGKLLRRRVREAFSVAPPGTAPPG